MRRNLAVVLVAAAVLMAQSVDISGTVLGFDSAGVSGVAVTHVCSGLSDTSDATGAFQVTGTVGVTAPRVPASVRPQDVLRTEAFDVAGRVARTAMSVAGIRLVQVTTAGGTTVARTVSGVSAGHSARARDDRAPGLTAAKSVACSSDTLKASAAGFLTIRRDAGSSTATGVVLVAHLLGRHDITVQQAHTLVAVSQGDPNFVVIDVRTATEFSAGHLQGAINIDYNGGTNFSQLLGALPRDRPYLVYCGSGARSGASMATFLSLGFQAYYNMQGGIGAWRTAGYPTVQ